MKAIYILFIALFLLAGCATAPSTDGQTKEENKLSIGVTFYPYYDLTKKVTNGIADVFSVVPPASEPHSFEPSARDFANIEKADVYVSTGVEFESFEDRLISAVSNDALVIQASKGIELLAGGHDDHSHEEEHNEEHEESEHVDEPHEEEHADEEHEENETHTKEYNMTDESEIHEDEESHENEEHHEEGTDPHVWLSVKNAMTITNTIAAELSLRYPEHAAKIAANTNELIANLEALDLRYQTGLAQCSKDTILVAHNAYQYLAKDYGFDVIAISGLSPESEPTAKQIVELIEEARYHNITVVYFEELVDPRVSETIASEVGAQTMQLNPVAGSSDGKSYIEIMDENLDKLRLGLDCS